MVSIIFHDVSTEILCTVEVRVSHIRVTQFFYVRKHFLLLLFGITLIPHSVQIESVRIGIFYYPFHPPPSI